ncbi:MAG: hypothetical protein JNL32_09600 [Candidatus Kapabacteria bacterium]|nr:hypothetical protein [Candidatus Kapabacteria bacterium]
MKYFKRFYKHFTLMEVVTNIFASYGVLFWILECLDYFTDNTFRMNAKEYWWLFLLIGLVYPLIKSHPRSLYTFKIPNRDSKVVLHFENAFDIESSSVIIPINNLFKVNPNGNLNNSSSMLSQFVKDFYDNKPENLQHEIDKKVREQYYIDNKEETGFRIGTVVPIKAMNRQFYLLANTTLNSSGRSVARKEELEQSLNELWIYLSNHAGKEHFTIPLLGTGRGRIEKTREEVIKEIILSFLASCSDITFTDKLTISVNPNDIDEHNMDVKGILKWSEAKICYVDYQKRFFSNGTNVLN